MPIHHLTNSVERSGETQLRSLCTGSSLSWYASICSRVVLRICGKLTIHKFPYIDFETENYLERHNKTGKKTPQLEIMTNLQNLYPPFEGLRGYQGAQTLDQSYYDMLEIEDLSVRDRDQVIYKWFKQKIKKQEESQSRGNSHRPDKGASDSKTGKAHGSAKHYEQHSTDMFNS